MSRRVTSLPAYRWPEQWVQQRRYAPWRWLAGAVFWLSRAAGLVALLLGGSRRAVAVIRTDGVGDAILFEPALRSLARQFDGFEIDLWAPQPTCDLLAAHPLISRFITVPRGFKDGNFTVFWSLAWRAKLGWRLGRHAYDVAVYPASDPEPLGNWLIASIRARGRWSVEGSTLNQFDWQRDLTQTQVSTLLTIETKGRHELERNSQLAELWGAPILGHVKPQVTLSQRALTYGGVEVGAARHAVRRHRANGLLGVVPAGSALINRYPPERWLHAIKAIWEQHRLLPALLGSPGDVDVLDPIQRCMVDCGVPFHRFAVANDIAVAAAIVSRLDALISVDTGLAHAAVAFDVPTVVLASGGMPGRFFPWPLATRSTVLTEPTTCAGCNYRCTQPEPICLTEIDPQKVASALGKLMQSKQEAAPKRRRREYRNAG